MVSSTLGICDYCHATSPKTIAQAPTWPLLHRQKRSDLTVMGPHPFDRAWLMRRLKKLEHWAIMKTDEQKESTTE